MIIHHLGIATTNPDGCERFVRAVFDVTALHGPVFDPNLNANLRMLEVACGPAIELVSGAIVASFTKRKVALYHSCYEVNDLRASIDRFVSGGARLIIPPTPSVLFGGREVAFMHTNIGLIEFLSR